MDHQLEIIGSGVGIIGGITLFCLGENLLGGLFLMLSAFFMVMWRIELLEQKMEVKTK